MKYTVTPLEGVYVFEPRVIDDQRGYFMESFKEQWLQNLNLEVNFIQDNESLSIQKGTLRGLHYQLPPYEQTKLIRVIRGSVFDVAVDIRKSSHTFGQWFGTVLNEENKKQLFIPKGFAHGFVTLAPHTRVTYKVDQYYVATADRGIIWNDPQIDIKWPDGSFILSDRDTLHPRLQEAECL